MAGPWNVFFTSSRSLHRDNNNSHCAKILMPGVCPLNIPPLCRESPELENSLPGLNKKEISLNPLPYSACLREANTGEKAGVSFSFRLGKETRRCRREKRGETTSLKVAYEKSRYIKAKKRRRKSRHTWTFGWKGAAFNRDLVAIPRNVPFIVLYSVKKKKRGGKKREKRRVDHRSARMRRARPTDVKSGLIRGRTNEETTKRMY